MVEITAKEQNKEKRIQSNDSEDDPGPRKKNGGKDQEDARNVSQRPRRIKEQRQLFEYNN